MSKPADLLALPATRGRLHALTAAGVLDEAQLAGALERLGVGPTRSSWARFGYWHSLVIGVVLVVVGAILFVAANWSGLSGLARMGLVGAAMVGATLAGGYLGESVAGRAVSLLGGLMFGPLLVVYSQVYQTGADGWQLFATWAFVLLGYAVLVRFAGTWVVVLVCVHVAWFAWVDQELGGDIYGGPHAWLVAVLALVDAGVVGLAERLLDGREREAVVHTAGVAGLAVVLPFGVVAMFERVPEGGWPGLVVLAAGLFGIWHVYRWRRPRLGMLVAFAVVVTILVGSVLGRVVFELADLELFGIATVGAMICGVVWAFTRWLLHWRHEQPQEQAPKQAPEHAQQRARPRRIRVRATLRELFAEVAPALVQASGQARLAEALHDEDGTDAPLIVQVFTAIGTWIGAGMAALVFAAFEIYSIPPLALAMAAGLIAGAAKLSRRAVRSLALTQLIWAMALGAHGLLLGVVFELEDAADPVAIAAGWTLLNVLLSGLIRVPSFQLASVASAVGFATWLASLVMPVAYPLWVVVPVVGLTTATWMLEVPWAARLGRSWSPLAYGLALGLLIPLAALSGDDVMVPIARHVPGISLALGWLCLAHLRRSLELQIIALVQFGGFLLTFYYQLETTLLLESAWVVGTGVVLLLGAGALHGLAHPRDGAEPSPPVERRSRGWSAIALTVLTVGLVAGASARKQWILTHGQTVLLPLEPVDPRSLIQGDYMVLRYALEREMGASPLEFVPGSEPGREPGPESGSELEIERHGRLIVRVDDEGVGHFVRLDDGGALGADELRLEYRLRDGWDGRIRVGADSFLFEEGSADLYAGARFGELVVAANGDVVLVGLRDANLQPLGLRLH